MNRQEQAQHISAALRNVCARINTLEHDLYTTKNNRDELSRLKRVRRALDRDLNQLVKTIPVSIQFSLFEAVAAPLVAPAGSKIETPFQENKDGVDPLPLNVEQQPTRCR